MLANHVSSDDGLIRIPIAKEQTGFLSQLYSSAAVRTSDENSASSQTTNDGEGKKNLVVIEPLTNSNNLTYIGEVMIGNPPQKVKAIFDTGSANPWIVSGKHSDQDTLEDTEGNKPYNPTKSTSFKDPKEADKEWVTISFGSGKIRGYFAQDQVMLGSKTDESN